MLSIDRGGLVIASSAPSDNHRPDSSRAESRVLPMQAKVPYHPARSDLAELAAESGLRRVHILAWRELADVEAGGSELHAANIARLWSEAGIEITVRTSYAQGHPPEATRDGYRVIRRSGRYYVFPSTIISELMGWHGPRDGILEIWNGVPWLTPLWARVPHAVVIHHVHRNMWRLVLEERLAKFGQLLESRLAPPVYRFSPIVTVSWSSKREIVELLGMNPKRVHVAPPGIDPRFHPGDEPKSPTPLLVSVGRLMPPKRFDEMIRIAAEVRRTHPDLQLVIVGDGYDFPKLQEQVREMQAQDWVRLPGRVSDEELLSLYRRSWAVTSASVAEGWGMTMTEAAACGTPAIATRITGHQDSVAEGQSGLLASSSREMVEKINAFIADPDLRNRLSEGARKHAANFTWEACAYGTFAPLAEAAIRRRRRRRALGLK